MRLRTRSGGGWGETLQNREMAYRNHCLALPPTFALVDRAQNARQPPLQRDRRGQGCAKPRRDRFTPRRYGAAIAQGVGNFLGDERQRTKIARALAANPPVILLDEAISAFDSISEHRVMEAIRRRGITCVVIAHRHSAIRACDEITLAHRRWKDACHLRLHVARPFTPRR